MTSFLNRTAAFLTETFGDELSEVAVVLPSRRAGLFLRRHLARHAGKPCWSPAIYSIEDFMTRISGLRESEPLTLLFRLYGVHREAEKDKAQSFDEYIRWAPQLLGDFNEIDRYLADPHKLFNYLDEARVLSTWNLDDQPLTEFETKYLHFYHSLEMYHERLSKQMLGSGEGWQGLVFRRAAEKAKETVHTIPWKQVVFAGFNALTRAEEQVIQEFRLHKKAVLLWDADPWYLNNEVQEAGLFLREWIGKWPEKEIRWVRDDFSSGPKDIRVIGTPDAIGQVKYCGSLLRELALQGHATEDTAVVLLDPTLLDPLLNSIPEEITAMNITAGLPLNQTSLARLFESIFRLHLNRSQFSALKSDGTPRFYYKDVLRVLRHPMVQEMATRLGGSNRFAFEEVIRNLLGGNRIFVSMHEILGESTGLFSQGLEFLGILFDPWNTPGEMLAGFDRFIEQLRYGLVKSAGTEDAGERTETRMELEHLFSFKKIFLQLTTLLTESGTVISQTVFCQLFKQILDSTHLPFSGEPLKGVQIMGMLETRNLDFENVILLSCNEDMLPAGRGAPSYIPYDIRRTFNLPTYRQKDAVYAYHFYRLLQRAKHAWILYSTEPNELGGGEKSRFIRQIENELPVRYPAISIRSEILAPAALPRPSDPVIVIPKSDEVMDALEKKALSGFSASTMNAYRNCSLRFYFSEIAGIREAEELAETIDPAILGQAIHDALAALYRPHRKKEMTGGILDEMTGRIEEEVARGFERKYKGADVHFGKNLLLVNVARILIRRFLSSERTILKTLAETNTPLTVLDLEEIVTGTAVIQVKGSEKVIHLKGFIDRLDRVGTTLRIIDYKSGSALQKNLKVTAWEDLMTNPDADMAFQLLTYASLLRNKMPGAVPVAGILPLKKINAGLLKVSVPEGEITAESIARFEGIVQKILEDVFDDSKPFSQTENTEVCKKCSYANLCRR